MDFYSICLLILLILAAISIVYKTIVNGISPMPSSVKVISAVLKELESLPKVTILELGSGWGSIAFPLAKKYPASSILGYENSAVPYIYSRLKNILYSYENLKLFYGDFFKRDLSVADVVICYLYPGAMAKLSEKLKNELKPGSWVISNTFALPGWTPKKIIELNDLYHTKVYLYQA